MIMSATIGELATALCAAQAEFTTIPKGAKNPFFKSTYADLPAVVEAASPVLTKHGLAVSQLMGYDTTAGEDTLTTLVMHTSGEYIGDTMRLHLVKEDPQGHGSATTYAKRYSYTGALALVADKDDDGNAGSGRRNVREGNDASTRQDGGSVAEDAPEDAPEGTSPATDDTLKTLAKEYKAAGVDEKGYRAILTQVGIPKNKGTADLTEDQATWVVLALREHAKTAKTANAAKEASE